MGRYKTTSGFSIRKLFLNILVLVCIAVPIWIAFQIFVSHTLSLAYGGIILAVDIGVLVWNISVLRHYGHSTPSFWLTTLVIVGCLVILSFTGVQPFTSYKQSAVDWVSTQISDISCSTTSVANIGEHGMWVDCLPAGIDPDYATSYFLYVELVPTSRAKDDTTYTVDLYEKGNPSDRCYISWNKAELNVKTPKPARFAIRRDEYDAYSKAQDFLAGQTDIWGIPIEARDNGWWRDIFSVEVYE